MAAYHSNFSSWIRLIYLFGEDIVTTFQKLLHIIHAQNSCHSCRVPVSRIKKLSKIFLTVWHEDNGPYVLPWLAHGIVCLQYPQLSISIKAVRFLTFFPRLPFSDKSSLAKVRTFEKLKCVLCQTDPMEKQRIGEETRTMQSLELNLPFS